jgi:hypothetical protein
VILVQLGSNTFQAETIHLSFGSKVPEIKLQYLGFVHPLRVARRLYSPSNLRSKSVFVRLSLNYLNQACPEASRLTSVRREREFQGPYIERGWSL